MTNKNLSRELCEICGFEGKQVEYTTETTDGCVNLGKKRVFPDFTQPENFVILQKKLIQELGMGFDVQLWDYPTKLQIRFCWDDENFTFKVYGNSLEEVFLRFAIQICELNEDGDIKQAIRETEWVYE